MHALNGEEVDKDIFDEAMYDNQYHDSPSLMLTLFCHALTFSFTSIFRAMPVFLTDPRRALKREFLQQQASNSHQTILAALAQQREFNLEEYPSQEDWVKLSDASLDQETRTNGGPSKKSPELSNDTGGCSKCLQRLWAIPRRLDARASPVIIPLVEQVPPYTAWVPVYKNFLIKTPAETYLPFLGNRDTDAELSHKALEIMEKEERKKTAFELPSDGEVDDKSGFFIPRGFFNEMVRIEEVCDIRERAAARHVTLQLVRKYGSGPTILNSLKRALKLPDTQVVIATFNLAEKRFVEGRKQEQIVKRSKRRKNELEDAMLYPQWPPRSVYKATTLKALFHFCFVCQEFACDLHEDHRPVPVLPISDESLRARLQDIGFEPPKPCSQSCYAAREIDRSPVEPREREPWNSDELQLFCEAVRLFRKDPCSISTIIGSRNCREVKKKLDLEGEKRWLQDAIDPRKEHEKTRRQVELMISALDAPEDGDSFSDGDDEALSVKAKKLRKLRSSRKRRKENGKGGMPRKTSVSPAEESLGQWSSRPCNHVGDCTETCPCVVNGDLCESFCACNGERSTYSERFERITVIGSRCRNRVDFCQCPGGKCDPIECACSAELGKTCDPERCHCDSGVGPWEVSLTDRKCKNSQVFTHKITRFGRSDEAGFGLFAGEKFEKGDLIGPYIGALLPAEIVDGRNAVGGLTSKMYTFDIRNVTVDGTTLGAKVRFINHKEDWESPNCLASEVRSRGHWFQRLTAARAVEPGEEFFFDYKIVDPSTRDDCAYSLPPWLEERRRCKTPGQKK